MTIHRLSQGGADRVAMLLANGFLAAGYAVDLLVLRDGGEAESEMLALLDSDVNVVSAWFGHGFSPHGTDPGMASNTTANT